MRRLIDLTGQRFGRWTVLYRDGTYVGIEGNTVPLWYCRCDCGTEKRVSGRNLREGSSLSCGCRRGRRRAENLYL